MGNGASASGVESSQTTISLDGGEKIETARLKLLYPEIRAELKQKDELVQKQNKQIKTYEDEIKNLKREINQLKSVLEATTTKSIQEETILEESDSADQGKSKNRFLDVVNNVRNKRIAISAETSDKKTDVDLANVTKTPKSAEARKLIMKAFQGNQFLKHLEDGQVKEIVMYMHLINYKEGDYLIKEGDSGNALFVINKGKLQVHQGDKVLGSPMQPGILFGELAILYDCTRTASVKALEDVEVWSIERQVFQSVMKRTGNLRRDEHYQFLKSAPIFSGLDTEKLYKITEVCEEESFQEGEYIIREGERGDSFFILKEGMVKVLKLLEGHTEPQEIRTLNKGDYFGEKALLSEDLRTASIIALAGGVNCLVIERENFLSFIGDLDSIKEKDYGDLERKAAAQLSKKTSSESTVSQKSTSSQPPKEKHRTSTEIIRAEFETKRLSAFKLLSTLGMGGFGRVELIQDKENKSKTYALKCLIKQHVVETKQQEHVFNEKKILMSLDSPFIINLYKTFKDKRFVYFLMEVCLGGELWTILRDKDYFDEPTSRFYTACVVEAFEYLHARGIVFRDLKPENLLLDNRGYVKLVDFGFAKKIKSGTKTWTFCGTPEYVAPEIILNKGHDCSADYWSLGVLIYELMTGNPPFTSSDPMNTYNIILRGIDALEFSSLISRNAQLLIKRLCKENPMERLGNQKDGVMDIRKHKWFTGFHWSGLQARTLQAPIMPKIKDASDHSNFDYFSPNKDIPPEENSGWDSEF
ncbi:cGMP-dependent protein kinase 1-like [Clytia hemisphaerica]|uniref:cGMP-dependent protein kinase n=1 Tax=Clytia hemisphaerica TaxID=252671 RepID=A0A7M5V5D4_9CNID|eukprot:TCONS_00021482-protein